MLFFFFLLTSIMCRNNNNSASPNNTVNKQETESLFGGTQTSQCAKNVEHGETKIDTSVFAKARGSPTNDYKKMKNYNTDTW